jgi:2-polyprenyl-3-methyl-5-hydroxy-6-metoxy-1,4-benzoquinol methylase
VADWRLVLVHEAARATGLLDALPATAAEAADRLGLAGQPARAVLDTLVSVGVLAADADGTVRRGPHFPDDATAAQLRQHASTLRRWATTLEDRLRGEEQPGRGPFDLRSWLASMAAAAAGRAGAVADAALAATAPDGTDRVVEAIDLGGGHGRYAAALAARGAHVILQDRADVIDVVRTEGWLDGTGVRLVAGDVHDVLPDGPFDVVLAVGLLHTMEPDRAASLLRRIGTRMRAGGVVVIGTTVRGVGPASALFAVQMAVSGQGGDTHGLDDYRAWLRDAGFGPPELSGLGGTTILLARFPV